MWWFKCSHSSKHILTRFISLFKMLASFYHDSAHNASLWISKPSSYQFWRRKWQSIPAFLPGKSHAQRGAWWATVHGGHKESDMTEQLTLSLLFLSITYSLDASLTRSLIVSLFSNVFIHLFFYWSIVNVQCSVSFQCIAKWSVIHR